MVSVMRKNTVLCCNAPQNRSSYGHCVSTVLKFCRPMKPLRTSPCQSNMLYDSDVASGHAMNSPYRSRPGTRKTTRCPCLRNQRIKMRPLLGEAFVPGGDAALDVVNGCVDRAVPGDGRLQLILQQR